MTGDEAEAIAEQEIKTVATVNTETLNVRAEKSTDAAVLSQVGNSEAFTVNSVADGWVEISVDDSVGHISCLLYTSDNNRGFRNDSRRPAEGGRSFDRNNDRSRSNDRNNDRTGGRGCLLYTSRCV